MTLSPTARTRLGWVLITLGTPFILYVVGFQMAHYADMTPWAQLQALWPHCLIYVALCLSGMAVMPRSVR
jgi:hypothetical protein